MDAPKFEIVANQIPFAFQDIYSYVDLYLNKTTNELTAITASPLHSDSIALVTVYSLAYPPLAEADLYQKTTEKNYFIVFLFFFFGLVLTGMIIAFVYSRKRKISSENKAEKTDKPEYTFIENSKPVDKRNGKNAIFLFGGFQVMDNEGKNSTSTFPSLAKQLFLLILLHTLKDGNGITSSKIRDTLWFDKSAESAKNNQGVLTNRLRMIFEKVNSVNIINKNSYWTIKFGDTLYCDYYEVLVLLKNLKNNSNPQLAEIKQLLNIVLAGAMLPDLQTEWIDSFKADFSNDLIDSLLYITRTKRFELSPSTRMDIADAIFIHDSLNEDALKLKCQTLIQSGKNGLAKGVYNSFSKEYFTLLGTPFKLSFEQVLNRE
jgi:two-component SAPR family response regulator